MKYGDDSKRCSFTKRSLRDSLVVCSVLSVATLRCMLIYTVDSRLLAIAPAQSTCHTVISGCASVFALFLIYVSLFRDAFRILCTTKSKCIDRKSPASIYHEFEMWQGSDARGIQTEKVARATPSWSETPILTGDYHVTMYDDSLRWR